VTELQKKKGKEEGGRSGKGKDGRDVGSENVREERHGIILKSAVCTDFGVMTH
jgi:hypothetical protein